MIQGPYYTNWRKPMKPVEAAYSYCYDCENLFQGCKGVPGFDEEHYCEELQLMPDVKAGTTTNT